MKKYIYATATLTGTIIGVGMFSLPYLAYKVGFWIMMAYFLGLAVLVAIIHLFFGEVALATPDFQRLPGYARFYLGKWGGRAAFVSGILGSFGAILAYLIVGGEFLKNLLSPFFGGDDLFYTLLYFSAGALLIFLGIKAIAKIEFWGLVLFFVSLVLIAVYGLPFFKIGNLFTTDNWKLPVPQNAGGIGNYFLPYGPILFALSALSIIPEIEEMLGEQKKKIGKVIIASIGISSLVYLFFIILILGVAGASTSKEALGGLMGILGQKTVALAFFAGLIATFTSFVAIGLTLKKIFWYDLKISKIGSWAIACFIPLALFLAGFKDFIKVIGLTGSVMMAFDGILILLMFQKIKQGRYRFAFYFFTIIFVLGIIYEIFYFLK